MPILPVPMLTRFILINTSHAGNVGAAARAMKTMGFDDLVLVAPRWPNVLRRDFDSISKCSRDFGPPTVAPREHFEMLSKSELLAHIPRGLEADLPQNTGVGFLFGSERFGMRNEDVYRCHACLSIPSNPKFGSLNIGAAIQVIAYEWRLALGGFAAAPAAAALAGGPGSGAMADAAQVAGMLTHLEQSLVALGFLDPAAPKKLMPRLNQLFNRAGVTQEEIHILRGIAKAILQQSGAKAESGPA
jgi:tRNA/rRNA methyltransferase